MPTHAASGGSRGIGPAIALGAATLGENAVLLAEVLSESGATDLSKYGGGNDPMWDIFVDKT